MKTVFYSTLLAVTLVVTALLPQTKVLAQSALEPAIVMSMASISEQLDDVAYLTEAAGFGQMGAMAKMQAEGFLKGVDKTKKIGALFYFVEGEPEPKPVLYVPVKNLDDVLDTISRFADVEDGDDYTTIQPNGGPAMFVKAMNGYAVIVPEAALLENAVDNVESLISDLPGSYNVGARIFAQRIPADMRAQALDMIENGYMDQLEGMSSGDDLGAELQMKNFEMQMKQIRSLVNETDNLVIGLDFDKANKNIHLDIQMVGLDGSILARQSENYNTKSASRFAGFMTEGATFTANMNMSVSGDEIEQYNSMLSDLKTTLKEKLNEEGEMPAEQLEAVEGLLDEMFGLVEKTLKDGKIDSGANIILSSDGANLAAGMACSNPSVLESKIVDLVKSVEDQFDGLAEINLNSEKFEGVSFHEIIVPIPEDEEELNNLIGETAKVYLGFGKDCIYIAAGSEPMENLKSSMTTKASSSDKLPMQYNVFLAPLLKKIAEIEGEDMMNQMADKLADGGGDRIRMSAKSVTNGIDMRLEIQDGVLALIQVAATQFGMGAPADF